MMQNFMILGKSDSFYCEKEDTLMPSRGQNHPTSMLDKMLVGGYIQAGGAAGSIGPHLRDLKGG